MAFYGIAFVFSLYFQRVLGESAVSAGLLFLLMTGLLTVASLVSARVAARRGHHLPLRFGLSTSTLGMVLLVFLRGRTGWEITLVPAGAGLGFALPSLTFLLLDSLPAAQAGLGGGLFNSARQTSGALAVAVFGALISGSFSAGMRKALLISVALLAVSTAAAFVAFLYAQPCPPPTSPRSIPSSKRSPHAPVVDSAALDEFLSGWWRIATRAAADPADWEHMHQEAGQLQSGARSADPILAEVLGRRGVQL